MKEIMNNSDFELSKMNNKVKLQLIEKGKVVQEVETKNLVTDLTKYMAQAYYAAGQSGLPLYSSSSVPGFSSVVGIQLWDNTTTFLNNTWMTSNNGPLNMVGYCNNLGTALSDSKTGAFLASASIYNKGGMTYTWEWATTQGNGTIKSLGFVLNQNSYLSYNPYLFTPYAANIPNLKSYQHYIGCATVGADKIFYFRTFNVGGINNIVSIKETDFSTVETLSLNIAGAGGLNGSDNSLYVEGDTLFVNNNFYTITAISGTNLTFKKAPKSTLIYGSAINIPYTSIATGTHYVESITSDDRYIYALIKASTGNKSMIVTIDTQTDTVTTVVDTTAGIGYYSASNFSNWVKLSKCPFTPDLIFYQTGSTYTSYAGQYFISTNKFLGGYQFTNTNSASSYCDMFYQKNGGVYFKSCSYSAPIGIGVGGSIQYPEKHCNAIFRCFGINSNILTYAELPAPVTKTASQSMRIQYSFQVF